MLAVLISESTGVCLTIMHGIVEIFSGIKIAEAAFKNLYIERCCSKGVYRYSHIFAASTTEGSARSDKMLLWGSL